MNTEQSPILQHIRDLEKNIPELKTIKDVRQLAQIEQEIVEKENTYKSCCLIIDLRAVKYFSQLLICITVITLCIFNLVEYPEDCNSNQVYIGLLTMIVGVFIPSPKLSK